MKFIKLAVICFIIVLLLSACAIDNDDLRYTGVLANDEVVSSIKQEMADKENSLLANKNDVFWTESGKLWHKSCECSYLANSKTILHGTIEEAKFEGKEKACERCSTGITDSIYDSLENNEYKQGDVFFIKEDDVWHIDINCDVIVGAQKIYFADEETAKMLGKTTPCGECEH